LVTSCNTLWSEAGLEMHKFESYLVYNTVTVRDYGVVNVQVALGTSGYSSFHPWDHRHHLNRRRKTVGADTYISPLRFCTSLPTESLLPITRAGS
jgi:hypothetical protein